MSRTTFPMPMLLAFAIGALTATLPALAAPQGPPQDRGRALQDARLSLSEAVRKVERDTRGEVLSAERVQYDGRDMHRVKVLDDEGRVRVFMQDPRRSRPPPPRGGEQWEPRRPTRDDDD